KPGRDHHKREASPESHAHFRGPQVPSYCKSSCNYNEFVAACKCIGIKPTTVTVYKKVRSSRSSDKELKYLLNILRLKQRLLSAPRPPRLQQKTPARAPRLFVATVDAT